MFDSTPPILYHKLVILSHAACSCLPHNAMYSTTVLAMAVVVLGIVLVGYEHDIVGVTYQLLVELLAATGNPASKNSTDCLVSASQHNVEC